jgi:hypothetical protein
MRVENRIGKHGYAARRLSVRVSNEACKAICVAEKALGLSVCFGSLLGQIAHSPSAAKEEPVADLLLELIHLMADRCGGNVQQIGTGAKATRLDDGNENLESTKGYSLHRLIPQPVQLLFVTARAVIETGYHMSTE